MRKSSGKTQEKPICSVGIYGRHSSDKQNPTSADDQIRRIIYHIERKNLPLIKYPAASYDLIVDENWVLKDEAETGKVATRKGYNRLLEGIRNKAFDAIIVDDLSRLTRDLGDQLELFDLLRFHKIELFSVCDGASSESSNARVHFIVKGLVNELGNEGHALRTKRGQEVRVLQGYSTGDICYGYYSEPTQTRTTGGRETPSHYAIKINPKEAKVVQLIFELKAKGMGYSAISKYLNDRQIPSTTRGQKITGRHCNWSNSLIRKILTRRKYIGDWDWGKTTRMRNPDSGKIVKVDQAQNLWVEHLEGKQLREDLIIVNTELWNTVQNLIDRTTKIFQETKSKVAAMNEAKQVALSSGALLAGILHCSQCGGQFLQITGRRGGYYGCYTHHRKDKSACSNKRLINRPKVESKVIEKVQSILLDQKNLELATKILNEKVKQRMAENPENLKQLGKRKLDIEKDLKRLLDFVMKDGGGALSTVRDAMTDQERQLDMIKQKIRSAEHLNKNRILVTPFTLKDKYQRLAGYFAKEPRIANAALRQLIPGGIICAPKVSSEKKNHNQNNSEWTLYGRILVGVSDGFSNLGIGGGDVIAPTC
ncbi:MAG: recombinase family protein [Bdellovibrio sp.]|nr:recombinase family protein [Bdellovibrio sp.]